MKKNIYAVAAIVTAVLTGSFVPASANDIHPTQSDAQKRCITSYYKSGLGCAEFADEFNGNTLNESNWEIRSGYRAPSDLGIYDKKNLKVSNGTLKLNTKVESAPWGAQGTGMEIATHRKVAYERFYSEIKLKIKNSEWSGVYFYNEGNVSGPRLGEIDVAEGFGRTKDGTGVVHQHEREGRYTAPETSEKTQSLVHFSQHALNSHGVDESETGTEQIFVDHPAYQWRTYGVLKDKSGVRIYQNGKQINYIPASESLYKMSFPSGTPMHLVLAAHVGNKYWGMPNQNTGGIEVDYVRTWSFSS
ncbi:MAG: DUF1080 domain-containing protein [Rothia sp. (in: high G+C Gram-positive bacteria)]|nr:DUF1080 domain-containing protein [Rothia sp. (in: high G+C Gram-positive bacteria)]